MTLFVLTKEPRDELPYFVSYRKFLDPYDDGDYLTSVEISTAPAEGFTQGNLVTPGGMSINAEIAPDRSTDEARPDTVRVWFRDGVKDEEVHLTLKATTSLGKVKEDQIRMRVIDLE